MERERVIGNPRIGWAGLLAANWLSAALIAVSAAMIALICVGFMSKARPGVMTWGPTTDIWAISIAFDDIINREWDGMGRRETSQTMAPYLTSTSNDIGVGTDPRFVGNPENVDRAIKAGWKYAWMHHEHMPLGSGAVQTTAFEDIGFSDFYQLAFRLFGVGAYSTQYMYCALLILSAALFAVGMFTNQPALGFLALASTGLFVLGTSSIFYDLLPNLSANRYLSTLAVIPGLHLLMFAISERKTPIWEWALFLLQCCLFGFIITLRLSATWAVLALPVAAAAIFAIRFFVQRGRQQPGQKGLFHTMAATPHAGRIVAATLLIVVGATGYNSYRLSKLNEVYSGDDVLPSHFKWHSAWLGMSTHPDWMKNLPNEGYRNIPVGSDNLGWTAYEQYMAKEYPRDNPLSSVHGLYKARLHDEIVKKTFFEFVRLHPKYVIELYLFYKPLAFIQLMLQLLGSVPLIAWLVALPSVLLSGLAFNRASRNIVQDVLIAWPLFYCGSLIPPIWAYSVAHSAADQTLMAITFVLLIASLFAAWAPRFGRALRRRIRTTNGANLAATKAMT